MSDKKIKFQLNGIGHTEDCPCEICETLPRLDPNGVLRMTDETKVVDAPKSDARTWLLKRDLEDIYLGGDAYEFNLGQLSELLEAYALPIQQQRDAALANPSRGICSICHATIWHKDAYMEEGGKPFHPICKVIRRADKAASESAALRTQLEAAKKEARILRQAYEGE